MGIEVQQGCALQSASHQLPSVIACLLIVDIHEVDFLEFSPFHTTSIEIAYAVGWQIGHFNAQGVLALAQGVAAVELEGCCPCTADELAVDIYACRLIDFAQPCSPLRISCHPS